MERTQKGEFMTIIEQSGPTVTGPSKLKLYGEGHLSKIGADRFRMDILDKNSRGRRGASVGFTGRVFEDALAYSANKGKYTIKY